MKELRERAAVVPNARLLAQPDRYAGRLLYFEGRVNSVSDDGRGNFRARIRTGDGAFIHLVYESRTYWGQPLVPGDRIRVVGYLRGASDPAAHGERVPVIEVYDLFLRFT
jgi:hypothetical protein